MEVVRRRRRPAVAPEHVHRLLAVEAVARREGEQLHELARLLQPPGGLRDRGAVDGGSEATQQGYPDIAHAPVNYLRLGPPGRGGDGKGYDWIVSFDPRRWISVVECSARSGTG